MELNGKKVKTMAELQGSLAKYRPGDKIKLKYGAIRKKRLSL